MKHWQPYIKAGWEIVMEAQGKSQVFLASDMEAFLVHVIARTIDKPNMWERPVAVKILGAQTLSGSHRATALQSIGEECLFIDGWQLKQARWPTQTYFIDMGEIAFGMASISTRPANKLLELASNNFKLMSTVLKTARTLNVT